MSKKKLILSFLTVSAFVFYAIYLRVGEHSRGIIAPVGSRASVSYTDQPVALLNKGTATSKSKKTYNTPSSSTTPSSNLPPAVANLGMYKDGEYTGVSADAYYGQVQVKAVIQGGKIVDVVFLSYPNDRGNSVYINSQAIPYLKTEAITVQNAQVDIISGATATSLAFQQSLASALQQAQI